MYRKFTVFFLLLLVFQAPDSTGQHLKKHSSVGGVVKDIYGEPLPGASVQLEGTRFGMQTDREGRFGFPEIPDGSYVLTINYIGYRKFTKRLEVNGRRIHLAPVLEQAASELSEIQVMGKTETQEARTQPIKAEVIQTRALKEQPSSLIEVMNRSAGIRIRQTGGLGSSSSLMLNGFQDRAVKTFRDGIPMDYLGAGYNISLVPVNMLERVEVYKGVLPAYLGSDALGGAVNLVTKKPYARYLETSYELASFNTHRVAVNSFYKDTARHFFAGADLFFNHSDNDYKVDALVTDPETANRHEEKVRLFHNRFTNYYAELYGGITDAVWADELRLSVTGFLIDRQNQYGARMTQPFGASDARQSSIIPTLRYRKQLFRERLSIDQFLVANTVTVQQTDTARGTYDWHGNFLPNPERTGEINMRGALSKVGFGYFTSRTHLSYLLVPKHRLELNAVFTRMRRKGSDPLGLRFVESGRDVLSVPAYFNRQVLAAGLTSTILGEKLTNNLIVKYFSMHTEALDSDYRGAEMQQATSRRRWGLAEAIKYEFKDRSFLRASFEVATRLPEQDELFGDGNLHLSNFALKPERSANFNLGYRTARSNRYTLELNAFYRITHDLILRMPHNFLYTQNQNVENVRGPGLETDLTVHFARNLTASGNFTYQDFRLFNTASPATNEARLRNMPYFFANLGLNGSFHKVFKQADRLQAYWYFTFVREYYLDYLPKSKEPDGFLGLWGKAQFDAPNIIPNQNVHFAGITYQPAGERLSLGMQVKNLFNTRVYDNFRIQNAGRSLHFKVNYLIR